MTKPVAIAIRIAGDPAISRQIVRGLEAPELARLRAELGVRQHRDAQYYQDRIARARREYAVKPMGRRRARIWGLIALVTLLLLEPAGAEEVPE